LYGIAKIRYRRIVKWLLVERHCSQKLCDEDMDIEHFEFRMDQLHSPSPFLLIFIGAFEQFQSGQKRAPTIVK
jgi:hypothetical protein